ncbi:hypothetical protein VTP01DRAFT_7840 [Rhizomucor pusillus]|uniref:uncharacterized protein n=1 Tax=Rhizomucor pusillus TaxID=4840 RepID=UPI00374407A5
MSWQQYVDSNLVGTGHVSKAAIYGLNGGQWAVSPGFSLSSNEIQELKNGFTNADQVQASGVHVNGVKYLTLRADDRSIYGKKGADGVCIVKTNQAILVGVYTEGIQPGQCTKVVEGLADYLISVGYVSAIFGCITSARAHAHSLLLFLLLHFLLLLYSTVMIYQNKQQTRNIQEYPSCKTRHQLFHFSSFF